MTEEAENIPLFIINYLGHFNYNGPGAVCAKKRHLVPRAHISWIKMMRILIVLIILIIIINSGCVSLFPLTGAARAPGAPEELIELLPPSRSRRTEPARRSHVRRRKRSRAYFLLVQPVVGVRAREELKLWLLIIGGGWRSSALITVSGSPGHWGGLGRTPLHRPRPDLSPGTVSCPGASSTSTLQVRVCVRVWQWLYYSNPVRVN